MAVEKINIAENERLHPLRREVIGASEVATVLGINPWDSPANLYARKKGLRPASADAGILRRGRWLEPGVFEALGEERPHWDVVRAKIFLYDAEHHLGATPDGFATRPDKSGRGICQAKVVSRTAFRNHWLTEHDDSIVHGDATLPEYYRLQTLTEMLLSACEWGVVVALIDSGFEADLRVFEVERNADDEALIVDQVARFWHDYIEAGVMPEFDPQRDDELIKLLYRHDDGSVIDLRTNNQVGELVDKLKSVREIGAAAEKTEKQVKAELQALMREHTFARLADGRALSWKTSHHAGYTVEPGTRRTLRILNKMPTGATGAPEEE